MRIVVPGLLLLATACSPEPAPVAPATQDAADRPVPEPVPPGSLSVPATPAPPPPPPAPAPAAPPEAAADAPRLAVEGEGLRWFLPPNGSARPIPFGRPEAEVLASIERVRGEAGKGINQDCGAGPVRYANWADGLSLVFQGGRFAGWGLDGRATGAIATADGIGPGATRAQLEAAYGIPVVVRQTSLGTEWRAGAVSGLLDGPGRQAKVTDMWAGVNCVAR